MRDLLARNLLARNLLARHASRLGCSPAEALALAMLCSGAAFLLATLWWQQRPVDRPEPPVIVAADGSDGVVARGQDTADGDESDSGDAGSPASEQPVHVHVTGAVGRPGVYALPPGSRVVDAVEAAGGSTGAGDLDRVNLAVVLADGMQVRVPTPGETTPPVTGPVPAPVAGPGPGRGPVDLNAADATALDDLPGVGPVTTGPLLTRVA